MNPVNTDPLHTRLCEEYGAEVPIVGFCHTRDVVAAVTNAGGIGVLGAGGLTPTELRASIHWIRDRVGDKPFGVDFLMPASLVEGNPEDLEAQIPQGHRDFVAKIMAENAIPKARERKAPDGQTLKHLREKLDILFAERIKIFASGLGSPAFLLEEAHSHGTKVWGLIGLPRQAQRQIEAGVDVVIAQGYDAGGHTGTVGTFTLVPEVVRMAEGTHTLILAAGGVNNGRQLAGVIAMGAAGVWTGTIWQATHESEVEMHFKQRLVQARAEDPDQSLAWSGKLNRHLPSKFTDAWKQPGAPPPLPMPLQGMLVSELQAGVKENHMEDWMSIPAGQSVVGIRAIKPAAEVVYDMVGEAQDCFDRLGGLVVA